MSSLFKTFKGVYIIAEVGINHNGNLGEAKKLIKAAVEAGANGVKIQVRDLEAVYTKAVLDDPLKAEQGTQYILHELKKAHLTYDDVKELFDYSKQFTVDFFATPFDKKSAYFLKDLGVKLFKIGSPDFTSLPLLEVVAGFDLPMILSTGMSNEKEILQVVDFLKSKNADFSLLHCNSTYPASPGDINLKYIPVLEKKTGIKVGYSGHERGYVPTLTAVALGAMIIERHITRDVDQTGPDHSSSLTIEDFGRMVADVRKVEESLGLPAKNYNQGEKNNRITLAKSLVAAFDLKAGTLLTAEHLDVKSPAKGVSPLEIGKFIGKKIKGDLKKDDYLFFDVLENSETQRVQKYDIKKTWGIVGRLNDYNEFLDLKPDLIEIHLTWRDLVGYESNHQHVHEQDLVVHAPEYFKDQLIDFSSQDSSVTEYSLEMLQRTIALARDLAVNFKGMKDPRGPRVVVHPGGHFKKATLSNKEDQYKLLKKNLKSINSEGVQLLVENMPPLPWYFGGQWYNTIFMDAGEIAQFAGDMKWGICYDTSHAQLYCNHAGVTLSDFTKKILDHVHYLHISDGKGATQEGLQIGQGDIDFEHIFTLLSKLDVGFIPEIWQGHLEKGRGFKEALVSLEKILKKVGGESCEIHK
ncbi:MAG: N-acetylneuraminate synthase family protein [Oligoflexia bacterium]|nr:N-acetylneuraminate synthase family protein [Oligoflexia bacterium]